jgi:5'/3'-nucleotidase SurE
MEAAVCGKKAIALSYAFFDRNHDPDIIAGASNLAVKLIEHLYANWDANTHLYSVNVPLVENVGARKVLYTDMLQNSWRSGSCFQVIEVPEGEDESADEAEVEVRKKEVDGTNAANGEGSGSASGSGVVTPKGQGHIRYTHKHFKWSPNFTDVYQSVAESEPGNDGWAVAQGYTSVTPLRANFMHVGGFSGNEIKLE